METETERYRDREIQTESERSRVRQRTEIETEAETESERQKDRDGDRARNRVKERYRQRQRVGDRDRETERQRQTDRDREETGGREGSHRRSQLQGEQRGGTPPTERSHCRRRHTYLLLVEASGQPGSPLSTPTPLTSPPRNKSGAAGLAAAFIGGRCLQERPGGQGSQCPGWGRGSSRSAPVTQRAGPQGTAQPPKAPGWGGVGVGVGWAAAGRGVLAVWPGLSSSACKVGEESQRLGAVETEGAVQLRGEHRRELGSPRRCPQGLCLPQASPWWMQVGPRARLPEPNPLPSAAPTPQPPGSPSGSLVSPA